MILADEGGDGKVVVNENAVHRLDDTSRGVKTYVIALLGLLAAITVIIVITSLLAAGPSISVLGTQPALSRCRGPSFTLMAR